jgi:hypothetical protein
MIVGFFLVKLSSMRLNALMVNRLYHVSTMDKEMIKLVKDIEEKESSKVFLKKRPNGDLAVGVPKFLDW